MTASESRRPSQRQGTAADQEYPASPLVYLSYRQEDEPYARRLNADLEWRLGKGVVLSGPVSLGFATQLDQQFREMLDPIDVLLLMLGPASPGDRVPPAQALEIASALAQGCQIVPVLVGGPRPSTDLPRALNEATKLRAVMLEDDSWDRDLSRLENAIQRAAAQRPLPRPGLAAGPVELLPEETRSFVNRERELKDLLDWFEDRMSKPGEEPPPVALITGQGGIGKSALAVRTAHQLRTRFPDGRLYASLGEAGARAEVLNQFLEAFGLDRRDLPESVEGLAELYQGILAGRRVLVVLDDIQAAGREGLLLPRAPGCGALLVSRSREIRADHILDLDTGLAERDALELLRQSAGPSFVDSNPELATELVRAVSGHPLTLQLVAAQARQSGASSLPWLAGLKALPDAQIRHLLLDRVYGRLPEVHRRLFRLLGVLPTPEFESGLAAALGGIDSDAANAALRSLVDNVLLEPGGDGRYRLGDLVGGFAAERLAADEPEEEQRAALERAIGWIAVRTAYEPQAPITRDYWTADDTLGYGQYAEAIAAFIRHQSTRPPLTIGVKGPWGAGKTSLMRMVQERLDPRANRKTWKPTPLELTSESRELLAPGRAPRPGVQVTNREVLRRATEPPPDADGPDAWQLDVHPPVTPRLQEEKDWRPTVWFNPWTYQSGEQIWAGLAYEIITQVTDRLATGDRERFWLALNLRRVDRHAVRRRVYRLLVERFLPWLLGLAVAAVVALAGLLAALVFPAAASGLRAGAAGLLSLAGTSVGVGAVIASVRFLHGKAAGPFASLVRPPDLVKGSRDLLAQETTGVLGELFPDPGYEARLGFLHLVQTDMRRVLDLVATERRPLVVFVDDLDRCSPGAVAQVIEAINLFLAGEFPNCIFVLAMEPAVVVAHVEAVYKDLVEHLRAGRLPGEWSTLGWRFLEKIVQLPLSLPPPDAMGRVAGYVESLLDAALHTEAEYTTAEERQPAGAGAAAPTARPSQQPVAIQSPTATASTEADAEAARADLVRQLENAIRRRKPTAETLSAAALEAQEEVLRTAVGQLQLETLEAANRVFVELYSDAEARKAIVAGVPGLASDNPREIKRFINLFRFYTFVAQQHRLNRLPAAGGPEIAKLAVIAIRWPSLLDAFGQTLSGSGTTILAHLEQGARAAAARGQAADLGWRGTLAQAGLVPEGEEAWQSHRTWAEQLRCFLECDPEIAAVAKRML